MGELELSAHTTQVLLDVAASAVEYVFTGHTMHAAGPSSGLKVPGGQAWHVTPS